MEGASKQAQRSGGFELRLQNTAQFMQRLFMEAPSLYRVQMRQEGGMEAGEGLQWASRVLAAPSSSGVEAVPISATARASSFRRCELEV